MYKSRLCASSPHRFMAHNGEINTLRGNENWMVAREKMFASPQFGDDIEKIQPVIDNTTSDSGRFDNALELLVQTGRSLPHAVMMMIPEAWQKHESMSDTKRAFYEYHSCLMEPWDGPASVAFTDGTVIGAILDRNGLRPSRYVVTKDGMVVMASEVGVLDIPPEDVVAKNRLQPGRMFLVDTAQGRIVDDEEIKEGMAARRPYRQWLNDNLVKLDDLPSVDASHVPAAYSDEELLHLQQAFGYTLEDVRILMNPMAVNGQEAVGSMGTDTPLAVLSDKPQPLFNYFKRNCPPHPAWTRRARRATLAGAEGCTDQSDSRSRGSVTAPGLAIARRVASATYAAGSTPASFAVSNRL